MALSGFGTLCHMNRDADMDLVSQNRSAMMVASRVVLQTQCSCSPCSNPCRESGSHLALATSILEPLLAAIIVFHQLPLPVWSALQQELRVEP